MDKINKQRLIHYFFELVKIDSPSGEEEKLANFLVRVFKNKVSGAYKDGYGNVYVRLEGVGEPIFLSAHMDTVEPGRNIAPSVKNGYVQSDGTTILGADNKIAIACFIELAEILKENKITHRPIEIIFTRCEETDTSGVLKFDYSKLKARVGYCFDNNSPVGTIFTCSPIYESCDIKLFGEGAHASLPEKNGSILIALNKFLNKIKLGKLPNLLFNIGSIEVGSVRNSIPAEAILLGEIRSFDEKALKKQKIFIQNIMEEISKHYNIRSQVEFIRENPGYIHKSKRALAFIEKTRQKIKDAGLKSKSLKTWGVSDANVFNNKGLLCLNLGDGGEKAHTKQERIKITEILNLVHLMYKIVT